MTTTTTPTKAAATKLAKATTAAQAAQAELDTALAAMAKARAARTKAMSAMHEAGASYSAMGRAVVGLSPMADRERPSSAEPRFAAPPSLGPTGWGHGANRRPQRAHEPGSGTQRGGQPRCEAPGAAVAPLLHPSSPRP